MRSLLPAAVSVLLGVSPAIAQEGDWDAPTVIPDNNVLQAWQARGRDEVGVYAELQEGVFDRFRDALQKEDNHRLVKGVVGASYDSIAYGSPLTIAFSSEHGQLSLLIEEASDHMKEFLEGSLVHTDSFMVAGQMVEFEAIKSSRWPTTPEQVTLIHYSNPDGWAETDMTCLARQVLTILYTDDDGSGYDVQACLDEAMQ